MSGPLLDLAQPWQRQRAQLRASRQRPPPLVVAGIDLVHQQGLRAKVQIGGMALVYGVFPATLADYLGLARGGLRLGPANRPPVAGVLDARILAAWAWLPTLRADCYLELDRATDEPRLWLVGPGSDEVRPVDAESDAGALDEAFLAGLVLSGTRQWGGREGLVRLVERFGPRPLLVAAQVAERLERRPADLEGALAAAHQRWPRLAPGEEASWEAAAQGEQPWVAVQLGRLALRLGIARAARVALARADDADAPAVGLFDLGQACEALGDLAAAEAAFARYAAAAPEDADGWRRLLFARLRRGDTAGARDALQRFRQSGGAERVLAERLALLLARVRLEGVERARLSGWICGQLREAAAARWPLGELIDQAAARLEPGQAIDLRVAVDELHHALRAAWPALGLGEERGGADGMLRAALLALPAGAAELGLACRSFLEAASGSAAVAAWDSCAPVSALAALAEVGGGAR